MNEIFQVSKREWCKKIDNVLIYIKKIQEIYRKLAILGLGRGLTCKYSSFFSLLQGYIYSSKMMQLPNTGLKDGLPTSVKQKSTEAMIYYCNLRQFRVFYNRYLLIRKKIRWPLNTTIYTHNTKFVQLLVESTNYLRQSRTSLSVTRQSHHWNMPAVWRVCYCCCGFGINSEVAWTEKCSPCSNSSHLITWKICINQISSISSINFIMNFQQFSRIGRL